MSILQWLGQVDREIFTFIHAKASSPSLDWFMLRLRDGITWIPLYLFVLYWILRKENRKYAIPFIVLSIACVAMTDSISARVLKPFFGRQRPCCDAVMQSIIRQPPVIGCGSVEDCPTNYSMPSSHASNHFGLAALWFFSILAISGRKWHWLWLWAALICYAQIYVGKHYPFDILAGAVFGTLTGFLFYKIMKRWIPSPAI